MWLKRRRVNYQTVATAAVILESLPTLERNVYYNKRVCFTDGQDGQKERDDTRRT